MNENGKSTFLTFIICTAIGIVGFLVCLYFIPMEKLRFASVPITFFLGFLVNHTYQTMKLVDELTNFDGLSIPQRYTLDERISASHKKLQNHLMLQLISCLLIAIFFNLIPSISKISHIPITILCGILFGLTVSIYSSANDIVKDARDTKFKYKTQMDERQKKREGKKRLVA